MKSYYHNGTVHGDAIDAPYGAEVFSSLLANTYSPTKNCVIWNSAQNSLRVDGTAGRAVNVNTGTAFIQGKIYVNTTVVNVTVPQNTTAFPRVDAIIVRFISNDNEARIAIKNGIPSNNPVPPTIKSNELLLAYLYLPAAFATIPDTVVYDKREFAFNSDHAKYYYTDNIMINSEFISFSGLNDAAHGSEPDYWTNTGTVLFYHEDKFNLQARGRCVRLVADAAGEGMTTPIILPSVAQVYTLAVPIKIISGICEISFAGYTRLLYPSTELQIVYIRSYTTTGATTLSFLSSGGAAEFQIGQITITQGYIPAPFEAKSEVLFITAYSAPTYGLTGQSSGALEIAYTSFGTDVLLSDYIKTLLLRVVARDSGSAGSATARIEIGQAGAGGNNQATLWLAGETNDTYKETFGITFLQNPDNLECNIAASGAGAFDFDIYVTGIIV